MPRIDLGSLGRALVAAVLGLALVACGGGGGAGGSGDGGGGGAGGSGAGGAGGGAGGGTGGGAGGGAAFCGDGTADPGETAQTCCADAGCDAGTCDLSAMACVDPWTLYCDPEVYGCSAEKPWRCSIGDLPMYRCVQCGCPGDDTCYEQVCYDPGTLAQERTDTYLAYDWPIDDYFTFLDWIETEPALTFAELEVELEALLAADARRVALIVGESHGSDDEQAVGIQVIRDLAASWNVVQLGIEDNGTPLIDPVVVSDLAIPTASIAGNLTNVSYCDAAAGAVGGLLNTTDGIYIQYTGSGHTSQATAPFPQHWTICTFPHTAECVLRESRLAMALVLFDARIHVVRTDVALMWRAGNSYPDGDAVATELDASIARWDQTFAAQTAPAPYDVTVRERPMNVRFVRPPQPDAVFFGFFPQPGRPAFFQEGFRAIWNDPTLRAHFLANDIRPGNCSVTYNTLDPSLDPLYFWCGGVSVTVDTTTFTVTEYDLGV